MFVVSEAEAAAIRAIFYERGKFSAAVELRRLRHQEHRAGARVGTENRRLDADAQATAVHEATLTAMASAETLSRLAA